MHYLACFTLFDNDPTLINSILDGFVAITPEQVQDVARRYLVQEQRAIVFRLPVKKDRGPAWRFRDGVAKSADSISKCSAGSGAGASSSLAAAFAAATGQWT